MKNKLPSLHSMNLILDCYSSLGKKKSRIGHSFSGYNCHLWKNEVMSPILITNNNTWMDDLKKIEGHFSKPFTPSKYTRKTPYFNLLTTGKRRLESKVISELKKMDWIASPSESSLNLWNSQIPLELP